MSGVLDWAGSVVNTVASAAQVYVQQTGVSVNSPVLHAVSAMQAANAELQGLADAATIGSVVNEILVFVEDVLPLVGQFVPFPINIGLRVAIALLSLFVSNNSTPATTPRQDQHLDNLATHAAAVVPSVSLLAKQLEDALKP